MGEHIGNIRRNMEILIKESKRNSINQKHCQEQRMPLMGS